MEQTSGMEIRPARRADRPALGDFLAHRPQGPPGADAPDTLAMAEIHNLVLAVEGNAVVGACHFHIGYGHCAVVLAPRLLAWNTLVASRLIRAAAAAAYAGGAKLIQSLTEPTGATPLADAIRMAGMERLAVLVYMRRDVSPREMVMPTLPPDLEWLHYRRLRHGKFARTIEATYQESLDCPGLSGIRTVDETITTHKHTGIFTPRAWHLAVRGNQPVGVCLVNNLRGVGEIVYLGVVPEARGQDVGRALVTQAIRSTAVMGLPQAALAADIDNTPAMRLYESSGFREIRRRLAMFVPAAGLESLHL
jgi:mycothiol synthase